MKILIAPDKFKGSLSAKAVCTAIAAGLKQKDEGAEIYLHPMADGGDGSLTVLSDHFALSKTTIETVDPVDRTIRADYFTKDQSAFIEVASASGLVLLSKEERNPMLTATLGTGKMIAHALSNGFLHIYLFLGGSATNDAGMGIANALGFQFQDQSYRPILPIGKNLSKVVRINNQSSFDWSKIKLTLLCDVLNPLFGPSGAAYIYAPQKGASVAQVQKLDNGLIQFNEVLKKTSGFDTSQIPGSGAAGGIGATLISLCGAKLVKGFDTIATLTGLEKQIQSADLVISGEGKLDEQSLQGKVIDGIAGLCKKHHKPLHLFVGKNDLNRKVLETLNIQSVLSIMEIAQNERDAMQNASSYLTKLAMDADFV